MIQHLFKLIWKQRRQNAWIAAELFLVFMLLWYIMDYFITIGYTASIENAYHIEDTYQVQLATVPASSPKYIHYEEGEQIAAEQYLSIIERIRQYPQVEAVCLSNMSVPYCPSYRNLPMGPDTTSLKNCQYLQVTPSYFEVFRIEPLNGGETSSLKDALTEKSIVISRLMAEKVFPKEQNPKGKSVLCGGNDEFYQIGGVCGAVKRDDYSREERANYFLLSNSDIVDWGEMALADLEISIRVKPGLNKHNFIESFQKDMREQLNVGNFLLYKVSSFEDLRDTLYLTNGVTDAIRYRIAFMAFLIFNIFLGIIGTFWFRNEYRKPEIGLRIAIGSTRRQILQMMIGEGWLLVSLVGIPAAIICINIAKMEFIGTNIMLVTFFRIFASLISTYLIMVVFITLGAWYPAYLSSRIAPADTLRSE